MSSWSSFGDVNPFDHGGFWIRQDEDFAHCFRVVELSVFDEDGRAFYVVNSGYVDLTDTWIDWKDVSGEAFEMSDVGTNMTFVLDAVRYYGMSNFGGDLETTFVGLDEAKRLVSEFDIEV